MSVRLELTVGHATQTATAKCRAESRLLLVSCRLEAGLCAFYQLENVEKRHAQR